jgi:YD repeat-containing protein
MVTRRRLKVSWFSIFAITLVAVAQLSGQDSPDISQGLNSQATYYGGKIDSVDMTTGRLFLHDTLIADHSQRGDLNFSYYLSYSGPGGFTEVCKVVGNKNVCKWVGSKYGIQGVQIFSDDIPGLPLIQSQYQGSNIYFYMTYVATADGGNHTVGSLISNGSADNPASAESIDGSGIHTTYQYQGTVASINRKGLQATDTYPAPSYIEDRNGNQISEEFITPTLVPPYSATDTLGRVWSIATTTNLSACPSTATQGYTWTVPGYNGGSRIFTFCYVTLSWSTAFNVSGVGEAGATNLLMTGIVLPNGATWRFDYDSWGELQEMHTPTGGTITYGWASTGDSCGAGGLIRTVASRTVFDGASNQKWNYSVPNGSGLGVTVTDPLNNKTVYTSQHGPDGGCTDSVNNAQYYSNGTLIKTVTTSFLYLTDPYLDDLQSTYVDTALPTQITTTWNTTNQVSQVTAGYDAGFTYYDKNEANKAYTSYYGLVLSDAQSDYGSGAPGSVLKTTQTNYEALINSAYLSANLLDFPSSVVVSGPSGKCSETDYGYDAGTLTPYSGAIQDSGITASVRANLTSITNKVYSNPCLSTSPTLIASPTTNKTYYNTGMLLTSTDPNSNVTTYGYSTSFYGAYPTADSDEGVQGSGLMVISVPGSK